MESIGTTLAMGFIAGRASVVRAASAPTVQALGVKTALRYALITVAIVCVRPMAAYVVVAHNTALMTTAKAAVWADG